MNKKMNNHVRISLKMRSLPVSKKARRYVQHHLNDAGTRRETILFGSSWNAEKAYRTQFHNCSLYGNGTEKRGAKQGRIRDSLDLV